MLCLNKSKVEALTAILSYDMLQSERSDLFLISRMSLPTRLVRYRLFMTEGLRDAIKMNGIRPEQPPIQGKGKDQEAIQYFALKCSVSFDT